MDSDHTADVYDIIKPLVAVIVQSADQDPERLVLSTLGRQFVPGSLLKTNSIKHNAPVLVLEHDEVHVRAVIVAKHRRLR